MTEPYGQPEPLPDPRLLLESGSIDDAVGAAFDMLEIAQADCRHREIGESEIAPAIEVLAEGSALAKADCDELRAAFAIADPVMRFQAVRHQLDLLQSVYEE